VTSLFLSISIFLSPLLPADIPANAIYLGRGVGLIHSLKLKMGEPVPHTGMLLTLANFIRLKSALEDSPDLCTWAIDQAIDECVKGLDREQEIALNREADDAAIIKAYESRLFTIESALLDARKQRKYMMYTAIGVGALSIITSTLYFTGR